MESSMSLEEMYARLAMEEEEGGGEVEGVTENAPQQPTFVLIGRFLTEKNINFQAMQNVLASIWRPREGMDIHDLGGSRYSFIFYHVLDLQKVTEGGPWTFEQSLLLHHKLEANEDAHTVQLNEMEIWVQIYDLPVGMVSGKLLESVGNYVGTFVKADPQNTQGGGKMFYRIRVVMDVNRPIKRRMKLKREGGAWSWINFKYERLSTFCFVCGLMGHSDRDCGIVYANPDKTIERSYGTWLRAPVRGGKNQNIGARWIRNGGEGGQSWQSNSGADQAKNMGARFMEVDGRITEISGEIGVIQFNQGNPNLGAKITGDTEMSGKVIEHETTVTDSKRKRGNEDTNVDSSGVVNGESKGLDMSNIGPKNLLEAGPVVQARLQQ
ncbi:uncharacterized protein LOC108224425 [Daucus carota subsp. sativus]|uniref:uncharacterized protein LOC108224425 n=1 Tax=Daucus carota subsp. sativus TaxID=79200 RepID=UPI0007F03ABE|nr:PREDICTED: uncharacterized protein LOC108224425 [Daucus carota subsp. sativus]